MRSAGIGAVLATLVLAVVTEAAGAATFCVAKPACVTGGGTSEPDLPAAVGAAGANGSARDRIELGSGTIAYAGEAVDAAGNPVDIVGAGRHDTTLEATGTALGMQEPSSTLSDVRIAATGAPGAITDLAAGTFRRVDVDATGTDPGVTATAIRLHGGRAVVDDAAITMAAGQINYAVHSDAPAGDTTVVRHLIATAYYGVSLSGPGALNLESSDVRGRSAAIQATAGTITVDDTLVRAATAIGLSASVPSGSASGAAIVARQVTVLMSSGATGIQTSSGGTGSPAVAAEDTVVHGGGTAVAVSSGSVELDYSAYAFSSTIGPVQGGHDLDLSTISPGFLDEAAGDARPTAASPLIDVGDPTLTAGPAFDLAALPRLRDGNGDGTAVRDIGAYEYQRAAPTLALAATPTSAGTDQEIAFSALAADADAGEVPTVTWSFDDGAVATGATTSHAFAAGGDHTATATATDPTGQATTSTITVHVLGDDAPPDLGDHTGPRVFIRVLRQRLDRHRTFLIGVFCPYTERPRCSGDVHVARGSTRIAVAPLRVTAGGTQIVKLRVSRATANLAHRRRRLAVVATIVARDVLGNPTTRAVDVTLRPYR